MMSLDEVKKILRNGPYAWPGGYQILFVMRDGELMHVKCARKHYRKIAEAHTRRDSYYRSEYLIDGYMIYWEGSPDQCCDCGETINSEYGDPEEAEHLD